MEEDNKVERAEGKPKGLIEKIWWIIPILIVFFVYLPLILYIEGSGKEFGVINSWANYVKYFFLRPSKEGIFASIIGVFMFLGYFITRKSRASIKIIGVSLMGIVGHLFMTFLAILIYTK